MHQGLEKLSKLRFGRTGVNFCRIDTNRFFSKPPQDIIDWIRKNKSVKQKAATELRNKGQVKRFCPLPAPAP